MCLRELLREHDASEEGLQTWLDFVLDDDVLGLRRFLALERHEDCAHGHLAQTSGKEHEAEGAVVSEASQVDQREVRAVGGFDCGVEQVIQVEETMLVHSFEDNEIHLILAQHLLVAKALDRLCGHSGKRLS